VDPIQTFAIVWAVITDMSTPGGTGGSSSTSYVVPAGLQELLIEFTVSVLVEQPPDLTSYAAEYFGRLAEERAGEAPHQRSDDESMVTDDDEPMPGEYNIFLTGVSFFNKCIDFL
jgi:hypothetical protein